MMDEKGKTVGGNGEETEKERAGNTLLPACERSLSPRKCVLPAVSLNLHRHPGQVEKQVLFFPDGW